MELTLYRPYWRLILITLGPETDIAAPQTPTHSAE